MVEDAPCLWESPQKSQGLPHNKPQVSRSKAKRVFSALPALIIDGRAAGAAPHHGPSPPQPLEGHAERLHPAWQLPGRQRSGCAAHGFGTP